MPFGYIADDDDVPIMLESIDDIDEQPVIIEDDDMSLDIIELSSEDIEEQSSEDDINEDIAEPSIAELEDCAKPGTVADAMLPATSRAAAITSSFFIVSSCWMLLAEEQASLERNVPVRG